MPGWLVPLWFCPCGSLRRRMVVLVGSLLACTAAFCSMVAAVGSSGVGLMSGWVVLQAGLHAWASKCWASCLAVVLPLWFPLQAHDCSEWRSLWLHCCFLQHGDQSRLLWCWAHVWLVFLHGGLHAWLVSPHAGLQSAELHAWLVSFPVVLPLWFPLQAHDCSGWQSLGLHCCFLQHGDCSGFLWCCAHVWLVCSSSRASCLGLQVLGFMPGCGFAPVVSE